MVVRLLLFLPAALVVQLILCAIAVQAATATVVHPEIIIEELRTLPREGIASNVSPAYIYPDVRHVGAYVRLEVRGFVGERKLTAFVTMSSGSDVLAKEKEKLKLETGRYEIILPEMLDLSKVFGEHRIKLYAGREARLLLFGEREAASAR